MVCTIMFICLKFDIFQGKVFCICGSILIGRVNQEHIWCLNTRLHGPIYPPKQTNHVSSNWLYPSYMAHMAQNPFTLSHINFCTSNHKHYIPQAKQISLKLGTKLLMYQKLNLYLFLYISFIIVYSHYKKIMKQKLIFRDQNNQLQQ